MLESLLVSFATLFATIGPPDVAIVFAALTLDRTGKEKVRLAIRATLIAAAILILFALVGKPFLSYLGISLAAMRTAGGILLLLIGIDMVFARSSGATSTTSAEEKEAAKSDDITVFPLATPLIAGPGTIGAIILLMSQTDGNPEKIAAVMGGLGAVLLLTFTLMILATQVQRILGVTGVHVIARVFGVLLSALAVQFLFDGIKESGLLG